MREVESLKIAALDLELSFDEQPVEDERAAVGLGAFFGPDR